jgi:hypothetical protein
VHLTGTGDIVGVDEIIGKTLFAQTAVPVKWLASDAAPVAWTVPAGQPVGVVYSYLMPLQSGRTNLYWMFRSGAEYYAEHVPGRFSFEALRSQGVITTEEQIQKQIEENKPWEDRLIDAGKWIAIAAIVVFAGVQLIPKLFASSQQSST